MLTRISSNALWAYLSFQVLVLVSNAAPISKFYSTSPADDVLPPWYLNGWLIAMSVAVAVAAVITLTCCACGACNSRGAMNADVYQRHMRQMRQLILQHNAPSAKPDVNKLAQDLRNLGVGEKEAQAGLLTVGQRDQLGIRDGDLEKIGGKENLFKTLRLLELQDIQDGQNAKLLLANRPQAVIRQQGPAIPVAKKPETRPQSNVIIPTVPQVRTGGLDERADLDDYTIYDEGMLNDYCIMKAQNEAKHVAQAGLDQNADFDDYTIYDEGMLNEYGLVKDMLQKQHEGGAGLDEKADFDDYTIYDEGNEVMREVEKKKGGAGAGADNAAAFDDYTVYETGELNEYSLINNERERPSETGAMTSGVNCERRQQAQLDATLTEQMKHLSQDEISTVYEKVPQQTVAKLGSSGRPKSRVKSRVRTKVGKRVRLAEGTGTNQGQANRFGAANDGAGLAITSDFDEYTIYDNAGPPPVRPTPKHQEDGTGVAVTSDFDEYTIYDQAEPQARPNTACVRPQTNDGGVGLAITSDFDEYTIYDQPGPQPVRAPQANRGATGVIRPQTNEDAVGLTGTSDFDEYTIYDQGGPEPEMDEDGAGLGVTSDFDEYTIYDQ